MPKTLSFWAFRWYIPSHEGDTNHAIARPRPADGDGFGLQEAQRQRDGGWREARAAAAFHPTFHFPQDTPGRHAIPRDTMWLMLLNFPNGVRSWGVLPRLKS
jgi:hypothetical protein